MVYSGVNNGAYAALAVIGFGNISVVIAVCVCFVFNRCGKSRRRINDSETQIQQDSVPSNTQTDKDDHETENNCETRTLKDSVLTTEAPPTYQMATKYPRVYAGQYYIGMNGGNDSEVQPWMSWNVDHLDEELPPDYHLVAPI